MPLELHRITSESDLYDFSLIQTRAFAYSGGMACLMIPTPLPADYIGKLTEKHIKSFREEADVTYLKVIDTDLDGKMIAGAKWRINEKERTEEEIQIMLPVASEAEKGNQWLVDFLGVLSRVRREYIGTKPIYLLHILITDPEHYRRGAGVMLLKWGIEQADRAQLPAFLESSAMGRPLYARMGYEVQETVTWDLTNYGLEGTDTITVMIRPAQPHVN